jgi:hypothetical protein
VGGKEARGVCFVLAAVVGLLTAEALGRDPRRRHRRTALVSAPVQAALRPDPDLVFMVSTVTGVVPAREMQDVPAHRLSLHERRDGHDACLLGPGQARFEQPGTDRAARPRGTALLAHEAGLPGEGEG